MFALLRLFLEDPELDELASWYRAGQRDGAPFGYGHAKQLLVERIETLTHLVDWHVEHRGNCSGVVATGKL